ncbi:hypothetical protein [Streptomyces sp. NPDC127092]|uniref:hypothetical protein n=1 Tax=Streptomyces sp. NPDC127092 TaxID=3347135 RepID=UPI00365A9329
MTGFELLDLSLHTEELGRLEVPRSDRPGEAEPIVVPEGTVISVGLTFRLDQEVDGLAFEESLVMEGKVLATTRTVLGGFRTGGPYEVRLPPERLPVGRAHCGVYTVTGRFTDGDGRDLGEESYRMRLEHRPAPKPGPHPGSRPAVPPHPAAPRPGSPPPASPRPAPPSAARDAVPGWGPAARDNPGDPAAPPTPAA